jgi:two-component system, cell cycle sensor histidine kinase and response regulator CckA
VVFTTVHFQARGHITRGFHTLSALSSGTKILVVEDESITAADLAHKLEEKKYVVTGIAASGKRAVELAKQTQPDLILMDVKLEGDLTGIEAAIMIESAAGRSIPILFLTAFKQQDIPELKDRYMFLNKPFSDQRLFLLIEMMLRK